MLTTIPALKASFYQRFLKRMSQEVSSTDQQAPVDQVELSQKQLPSAVANIVLTAAKVSGAAVGGALALSIASEVGRGMNTTGIQARTRDEAPSNWGQASPNPELAELWKDVKDISQAPDNAKMIRVSGGPDSPMAFFGDVIFSDASLHHFDHPAQLALVLGHEVAHLENKDSKANMGVQFLVESFDTKNMNDEPMLESLGTALKTLIRKENHRTEKEADKRGLEIAVGLGHDPKKATTFLAGRSESHEHPSGDHRLRALRAEGFAV